MENENYIKKGFVTKDDGSMGNLYLTSKEIIFRSQSKNHNNINIALETISHVKLSGINIIEIHLKDGVIESYHIFNDRKGWEELINNTIKENVKPFDESKEYFNNEEIKLYNDELIINHNPIKISDIKDMSISENILTLTLNSGNQVKIKTVEAKDILDSIKLQKTQEGTKVETTTFGNLYKKRFRFWVILGAIITFLDRANNGFYNTGMFGVIGDMIIWGLLIGIPASLISTFFHRDFDKTSRPVKFKCPYCQTENNLSFDYGARPQRIFCGNCSKKIFIKDYYAYKYTDDMDKYFYSSYQNNNLNKESENRNLDKYEELEKLKELLDKNIITQEEFDRKKEELLK